MLPGTPGPQERRQRGRVAGSSWVGLGVAADDPVFGAVRVQWRDNDVRNLYLVTLEIENASAKDFENVALTTYTGDDTLLLGERTSIVDAPDIVPWSPTFRVSTSVGKRVNLIMSSTTTCRRSEFGIVGQEPVWTGVRGAGVKAASPATAGAERSDAP